jgi:hypothetical protein
MQWDPTGGSLTFTNGYSATGLAPVTDYVCCAATVERHASAIRQLAGAAFPAATVCDFDAVEEPTGPLDQMLAWGLQRVIE